MHEIAQKTLKKHQQEEVSKVTNALANEIRALHGKLRASLEDMYAWMAPAADDPRADVKLSECVVSGMLRGNPGPRHVGSQSYGLRLMLGRRLYLVDDDQQRCEEQLIAMPVEKKRLVQWLDITRQQVQEHMMLKVKRTLCCPLLGNAPFSMVSCIGYNGMVTSWKVEVVKGSWA